MLAMGLVLVGRPWRKRSQGDEEPSSQCKGPLDTDAPSRLTGPGPRAQPSGPVGLGSGHRRARSHRPGTHLLVLPIVAGNRAMSSLSLNGLPIRADQHGRHQTKGAKAWRAGRPPQCQHLSSGTCVGSPGPSTGQVALRGGSHPPASIHPHPLPPGTPESMAPQGTRPPPTKFYPPTLAGDQEAHSSRKNKACGQLFYSHPFICSFEYVCISCSVVSDSSQPHRL